MGATAAHIRATRWPARLAARRPVRPWNGRTLAGSTLPPALLALATVAFCWKLLLARLVVIGYDTMTYMYPYRFFAAAALREGRLPLWNPYIYSGAPFLANLQSAVFYPLHVIFLVLRPTEAMNWSVALHLFLAGYCTYLAGRHLVGLDAPSATVAGAIYGLGGFVGAQVGHLNQLNAAAWLPAALCALHLAISRRSRRWVAATGAIVAVQLLAGHAQETYMTAVLLGGYAAFHALWTASHLLVGGPPHADDEPIAVAPADTPGPRWQRVWHALPHLATEAGWAFGGLAVAGGLAGLLAAAQLLPTNELTTRSIRSGGMPIWEASAFSLPPRELFVGLLPTFGLATPSSNEYLGWIGLGGLMLALMGLLFRVQRPGTLFFALVLIASFMLALGNHFLYYATLFHIPGMNLFRVPARWLMLSSLALALLAGSGLDFLRRLGRAGWGLPPLADAGPWRRLAAATRLLLGVAIVAGAAAALWPLQKVGGQGDFSTLPAIWLALAAGTTALAFWGLAAAPSLWPASLFTVWVLVELFAASRSLEYNNPNPESVYTESRPVIDALKADPTPGRLLSIAATGYHPSDADRLVEGYRDVLGQNGVLATWINTKYKETLNPNLPMVFGLSTVDGYDGGVLPLRRYVGLKRLFVPPEQNQPDALLRDQLRRVPNQSVLRLLGVKYLVADAIGDVTRDDVYYDLAGSVTLAPGQSARFSQLSQNRTGGRDAGGTVGPISAVGILSALEGALTVADGTSVAQVTLGGDSGVLWQGTLAAGRETAEGAYSGTVRHAQPTPLGPAGASGSAQATYLAKLPVGNATQVRWVEVQNLLRDPGQRVRVGGISLIGAGASWSMTIAGEDALKLVHRSDVKLYRDEQALPRAYVVGRAQVVDTPEQALDAMGRADFDPERLVILERDPGPPPPSRTALRARARALRDGLKEWLGVFDDPRAGSVPADQSLPALATTLSRSGYSAEMTSDQAEAVTIRVQAAQPALLVLRDTFFPGWEASVDGQPTPLWRGDYLFRVVPVPAGSHTVEFRFHSQAVERGLLLSGIGALLSLAVAFVPLPGLWRRGEAEANDRENSPRW